MLSLGRLAPPRCAAGHIVDELVMLLRQAVLLALNKERHGLPGGFAVFVEEVGGAVMLCFCRPHAGRVAPS